MTEKTANGAAFLPQLLERLGLYATYLAAALLTLVIVGDLAVLMRHAPMGMWQALLVGTGPLVALLLATFASYINYYGVWRILRSKDAFDAEQDLKSHAADVPQAVQGMMAGRAGCFSVAPMLLLLVALLLAVMTNLPSETPVIGTLGTWNGHLGELAFSAVPATPTATPSPDGYRCTNGDIRRDAHANADACTATDRGRDANANAATQSDQVLVLTNERLLELHQSGATTSRANRHAG